ncbi:PSD1 and planctomycete cytochrome C domain-containing protein [Botrimarina sp.]|uniref:PSD1 and planctomycete cytochrome C domain-containing protein n=1 Tax=Botrimarina sp. TaxID=2795802 RepID=UPI0032EAD07B
MRRRLSLSVAAAALAVLSARAEEPRVDFDRDIRPIFVAHCLACHGGVKQAAGVSFVYRDQVLPPDGWIVEPGDPAASPLLDRVTETDPDLRMPPPEHGPALSDEEVGLLRGWIAQGAVWREHWAFERPTAPAPPEASRSAWPRKELDRFVLRRLEEQGLEPSPDADPSRWLRRVSLDLVGLPPTPDERRAFLEDVARRGEAAYAAAVDRLLGSDHFGERWASVWLDQVRYADSRGLGNDAPRNAWKYRDWVIAALNDDLPYDEFTTKQLAGDLLPAPSVDDLVATTAHRLTQTNDEGGTDDEEFRVAAVLDRVNTTWQVWQGVTFGCAQCHSHPYDPIRHEEYYQFAALLNNTTDTDATEEYPTIPAPTDRADHQRVSELLQEIHTLREQLWRRQFSVVAEDSLWRPAHALRPWTNNDAKLVVERRDGREEFRTLGVVPRRTVETVEANPPEGLERVAAVRVIAMPLDPEKAADDSEWGFVWSHVELEVVRPGAAPESVPIARLVGDEPHPFLDPQESLNSDSVEGFAAYSRVYGPRVATLLLREPIELGPDARLRITINHRQSALGTFPLVTRRGAIEVSDSPRLTRLASDDGLRVLRDRLAALQSELASIPTVETPVMAERPDRLRRTQRVFERGLFLDKGELVRPGTPAALHEMASEGLPSRLDMAEWIVDDANPLTARVAVNRLWARLFGVGLVRTEEDFGSSGERPSHPELLDHLATRFSGDFDWSVKSILREIVLSSTYRQTSKASPDAYRRDPENRLLARGPRHRLPAETARDQALAAAGLLDRTLYGPPVRPPIPEGVWKPFFRADKWADTAPGDAQRYRRSIYTYTKRSIPYPMFQAFDAPSREFCTPRRLRSNTPLQALETLNSEAMVECAAALADRMRSHGGALADQIRYGVELTACREPTDAEVEVLARLAQRSSGDDALRDVATALLSRDEFLTK